MAEFQFVIDQNKNHLFRNESKILKDCLIGFQGFKYLTVQVLHQYNHGLLRNIIETDIYRLRKHYVTVSLEIRETITYRF